MFLKVEINSLKTASLVLILFLEAILTSAVPIEQSNPDLAAFVYQSNVTSNASVIDNQPIVAPSQKPESTDTSVNDTINKANATDDGEEAFVGTVGAVVPDQVASASGFDPAIYANLLTPETFQQYVNQFGAAYAPYAAAAAAAYSPSSGAVYPTPNVGSNPSSATYPAAGALYPYPIGPYVVQTGYEGYLVPTTTTTTTTAATSSTSSSADSPTTTTTTAPSTSLMRPGFLTNLLSALMMSTVFRVIATVLSTIVVVLFGNAVAGALCRLTPICDIPAQTVTFLRGRGAEDVGRMLTEGVTPERVRRAAEFVRKAIKKYRALQQLINDDDNTNDEQNWQQQEL